MNDYSMPYQQQGGAVTSEPVENQLYENDTTAQYQSGYDSAYYQNGQWGANPPSGRYNH
jgi:hypothetical protein